MPTVAQLKAELRELGIAKGLSGLNKKDLQNLIEQAEDIEDRYENRHLTHANKIEILTITPSLSTH